MNIKFISSPIDMKDLKNDKEIELFVKDILTTDAQIYKKELKYKFAKDAKPKHYVTGILFQSIKKFKIVEKNGNYFTGVGIVRGRNRKTDRLVAALQLEKKEHIFSSTLEKIEPEITRVNERKFEDFYK